MLHTFESFKNDDIIKKKLEKAEDFLLNAKHWKDEYGEWHINDSLEYIKDWIHNGRLIVPIYEVNDIDLEDCGLTTLEGCPKIVHRNFDVIHNNLTNLKGSPEVVKGVFYASQNDLTSIEGCPKIVGGFYYHINLNLRSLKGASILTDSIFVPNCINTGVSDIENEFYNISRGKVESYHLDLLKYILNETNQSIIEKNLKETYWPEGFLTEDLIKSIKGINKFML